MTNPNSYPLLPRIQDDEVGMSELLDETLLDLLDSPIPGFVLLLSSSEDEVGEPRKINEVHHSHRLALFDSSRHLIGVNAREHYFTKMGEVQPKQMHVPPSTDISVGSWRRLDPPNDERTKTVLRLSTVEGDAWTRIYFASITPELFTEGSYDELEPNADAKSRIILPKLASFVTIHSASEGPVTAWWQDEHAEELNLPTIVTEFDYLAKVSTSADSV